MIGKSLGLCYMQSMPSSKHAKRPRGRPLATGEEMAQLSLRLTKSMIAHIDAAAKRARTSRNEMVREWLEFARAKWS